MPVRTTIIPSNLGSEFDLGVVTPSKITVKAATNLVAGKVALAISSAFPLTTNDVLASTPAFVNAAISSAIASLPADKFLSNASFSNATGILTLSLSNGSSFTISLSDLLPVVITSTNTINSSGVGTTASPLLSNVKVDPVATNVITTSASGVLVSSTAISNLATIDVQDAFGVHLYYAYP